MRGVVRFWIGRAHQALGVAPNEARDRESWSAGLQRERMDHNVDTSWKAR